MSHYDPENEMRENIAEIAHDVSKMSSQYDDAYWLRLFAGMAMQGFISSGLTKNSDDVALYAFQRASNLLAEIKKSEEEKK